MKKMKILSTPALLVFVLLIASSYNANAQRMLQKKMVGTWQICNADSTLATKLSNMEDCSRSKVITKESFMVLHFGNENKQIYGTFYGTYTLKKRVYTESIQLANYGDVNGVMNSFTVKIKKNYMFITGVNNDYNEIWRKVKD